MFRAMVLLGFGLVLSACGGSPREAEETPPAEGAAPFSARGDEARDGDTFWMLGLYAYLADAGAFTECRTGIRLPVAAEGDNAALERAYLEARPEPGAPLLMAVEAHRAWRPPMEGDEDIPMFVVDRFISVHPENSCPPQPLVQPPLENTYWKLVELDGRPVSTAGLAREPHLRLTGSDGKALGFGGCNRFFGAYTTRDDSLSFGPLTSTRMHCEAGSELEAAYLDALARARTFAVDGEHLVLSSEKGPVARFDAGYFH